MLKIDVKFLVSASHEIHFPRTNLPEMTFVGKSNVGKSSLINLLCNRKKLVKVSKAPGSTKQINFFVVGNNYMLVDLPGYGYAKTSKSHTKKLERVIIDYLSNRKNLILVNLLIDSRHGVKQNDIRVIQLLEQFNRIYQIVFTKSDKISCKEKELLIEGTTNLLAPYRYKSPLIFTSTKSKDGMQELRHNLIMHFENFKY